MKKYLLALLFASIPSICFGQFVNNFGFLAGSADYIKSQGPSVYYTSDYEVYADAAVQFNASDKSALAEDTSSTAHHFTDEMEVSFWIRLDSTSGYRGVVGVWGSSGATQQWLVYLYNAIPRFTARDTDGTSFQIQWGSALSADTWYFVRAWKTGGTIYLQVDDGTAVSDTMTKNLRSVSSTALRVGLFDTDYYLDGRVDSLCIKSEPSSVEEVTNLYNSGEGVIYEDLTASEKTNVVSFYDFNGPVGGGWVDSHGSNHLTPQFADIIGDGVLNGGFESWTSASNASNWVEGAAGSSTVTQEATEVNTGTYSCKFDIVSSGECYVRQPVLTTGKLYSYSTYAKSSGTPDWRFNLGGNDWQVADGTWTEYSGTARASGSYFYILCADGTTDLYFDDVTLQAAEILPAGGIARGRAQDSNFAVSLDGSSRFNYSGATFDPGTGNFATGLCFQVISSQAASLMFSGTWGDGNEFYHVYLNSSNVLNLQFNDGSTPYKTAAGTTTIVPGVWYTVLVNWDRSGNAVLYLDGVAEVTLDISDRTNSVAGGDLKVGGGISYLAGLIDNAFYANRLVTSAERTYLHNNGEWRQWSELGVAGTDGENLTSSVITGWWGFEDSDNLGTDSANSNDLTETGSPTRDQGINYTEGVVSYWADKSGNGIPAINNTLGSRPAYRTNIANGNPVITFDGVDDYLEYTLGSTPTAHTTFVVFNCTLSGSDLSIWRQSTSATGQGLTFHSGNTLYSYFGAGGRYVSKASLSTDTYYVVARVWSGGATADDMQLFVDGVEATSKTSTPTDDNMTAAGGIGGTSSSNYFEGDVAAVIVFEEALSSGQISTITSKLQDTFQ